MDSHHHVLSSSARTVAGYGNTAPNDCWGGIVVIAIQTILGIFLDAVVLGIIFSRLSHPKNRGRTIAISDSAVICRRDGILKFMFRIADFRSTQVCCSHLCFMLALPQARAAADSS